MTVLVLGGGAAGMAAAIAAVENGASVILAERQARVGRKLLATGNGRCNLSNLHASPTHYHGGDLSFCAPALERFPAAETLDFFGRLGLITVTEPSGRVYPYSDQAGSVVDVLRFGLQRAGVQVLTGCEVTKIWRRGGGFLLKTSQGDLAGDRLILAAGGPAGGKLGGTDAGIRLLSALGHHHTALSPSLVQLTVDDRATRALKGVRAQAHLTLRDGGQTVVENDGEVQFTELGVSGPAVFELSRWVSVSDHPLTLHLDLIPQRTQQDLTTMLAARCAALPELTAEDLLTGVLHNRLGRVLIRYAGLSPAQSLSSLEPRLLERTAAAAKDFSLVCSGTMGLENAQVTAGGVSTDEFDPHTMESRLVPGLYACGEVLDIDGDCGGYNLQWAWSSGRLAGHCAAEKEV